jgi:hypothetical protein
LSLKEVARIRVELGSGRSHWNLIFLVTLEEGLEMFGMTATLAALAWRAQERLKELALTDQGRKKPQALPQSQEAGAVPRTHRMGSMRQDRPSI